MNQYRCETCTRKDPQGYGWCRYANAHVNPPNTTSVIAEFTARCGCASHSSHQSERDKVLDKHEEKVLMKLCDLIDAHAGTWNDLCEMQLVIRKLRQAGEP